MGRVWRIGSLAVAVAVLGLSAAALAPAAPPPAKEASKMGLRPLTPEEQRVILHRGTERPFTGKYWKHKADGTYTCRQCGAPLFPSAAKFDSGTGWPSFDDALPGAVREVPDADGMRVEIVCAKCGGHLGHVFKGEGFTDRDTRHCVNSASLDFQAGDAAGAAGGLAASGPAVAPGATTSAGTCSVDDGPGQGASAAPASSAPTPATAPGPSEAFFAGGCFWGVEYLFQRAPGVLEAQSGYMGGRTDNPSYEEVCGHGTGHVETVRVVWDPAKTTYEALAKLFFEIHDPTQVDRQGPDVGEQYRSVVFYKDEAQRQTALTLAARLVRRGYRVATALEPATTFWPAEAYHQDWYDRKGSLPYCHARTPRFGD